MTAERREAASPNRAGGAENPATVSQQTTDSTPDPAAGPPTVSAPPEPVPAPPAAFGRYQVRRTLGAGAFGAVYLGHDTQLERPVAIKVLRGGASRAQAEDEPALQEARRLAQLRHPGIVAVHDVGVQEGQVYIVSDYLDGPDLGRWLRDHRPTWPEAALVAAAVADALAHAHARLIIHRDVKPANILLTADGAPVLVDFGLALDETQAGGSAKGNISGTPWYMSPEQAAGAAHRIDGRTDIYSLGVVLYEMLTGRVPFRATDLQELLRQVRDDEPQPPDSSSATSRPSWNGPASRRWRSGSKTATPPQGTSPRIYAESSRPRLRCRVPGCCRLERRPVSRAWHCPPGRAHT